MKNKILAFLLSVIMILGVIPFSAFAAGTSASDEYKTSYDGALLAGIVPNVQSAGQSYQWTGPGAHLEVRTDSVSNERFYVVKNQNGLLEKSINASFYDAKNTYGAVGVPFSLEGKTALAIRIKINDLNEIYSYDSASWRLFLNINGQREMSRATKSDPVYWIEKETGAVIPFASAQGWWNNQRFSSKSNGDGYLAITFEYLAKKFGITTEEVPAYLEQYWNGVQFFFDKLEALESGDDQRRASDWKNFEFLYGGTYWIDNMDNFAAAMKKREKMYDMGDGSQVISNYFPMRNYIYTWCSGTTIHPLYSPYVFGSSSGYGFVHMVKLSDGLNAMALSCSATEKEDGTRVSNNGNSSFPIYDTFSHRVNMNTNVLGNVAGLPDEIDIENATHIAFRTATFGGTEDQISSIHFYTNMNGQVSSRQGNITYVDATSGEVSILKHGGNGVEIVGNIDGWLIFPIEYLASGKFKEIAKTTWTGHQIFMRGDWLDKTLAMGHTRLVTDLDKFMRTHSSPDLTYTSTNDTITVTNTIEGAVYSIDGQNWNTTGVFENLEKDVCYTIYGKYSDSGIVSSISAWTAPYSTHAGDGAVYFFDTPNKNYMIKYGEGIGWSNIAIWRNSSNTDFTGSYAAAHLPNFEDNGEYFIKLDVNEDVLPEGTTGDANIPINISLIKNGDSNLGGVSSLADRENLTHLAFRIKIEGGDKNQRSAFGIMPDNTFFNNENLSKAYLIDNKTRTIVDPKWTKYDWVFTGEFDGWVVLPFDAWGDKIVSHGKHNYFVPAKDAFLGTFESLYEGDVTTYNSFDIYLHNDFENNDTETLEKGCYHGVVNSSWVNKTLKIGDILALSDLEKFNSVRTSCSHLGHNLVKTKTVAANCGENGYSEYECSFCTYTERDETEGQLGHNYTTKTVVAPTCTEMGYDKHSCQCGEFYKDNYTAALGHSFGSGTILENVPADCDKDGHIIRLCDVCGDEITEILTSDGHSYSSVTVERTETQDGYTEYTCSHCGDKYRKNFQLALSKTDNNLGMSMYHFSSQATHYKTNGVNTLQDRLDEIEDVLAQGYVNTIHTGVGAGFKEIVALCRKYNCKFWVGPGDFHSKNQTIESYLANVELNIISKIKAEDAWNLFLGFHWDEPVWRGQTKEDFYTMTKGLYENWNKRIYPVYALGAFMPNQSEPTCDIIEPQYTTYVTDIGWDSYSWDVREDADYIKQQQNKVLSQAATFGYKIESSRDVYRFVQKCLLEKFDHPVASWFYPAAWATGTWGGYRADEGYALGHLNFFYELLMEQEKPGGLDIYTFRTFYDSIDENWNTVGGTPSLDQYLPIPSLKTGEQILFPDVPKWYDYAERLKELKIIFDNTRIRTEPDVVAGHFNPVYRGINEIRYVPIEDFEYSIDGGNTFETDGVFDNLTCDTVYTVISRKISTGQTAEFIISTRESDYLTTPYDDAAYYMMKVPKDLNYLTSKFAWTAANINPENEVYGALPLVTIEGERFIECNLNDPTIDGAFSCNFAFGDKSRSTAQTGFPYEIEDTSKLTGFAYRIKSVGGTDEQTSKFTFYMGPNDASPRTRQSIYVGVDGTVMDIGVSAVTFTGNIDGWILVDFDAYYLSSTMTNRDWINNNLSTFKVWLHGPNCNHGSGSNCSWQDKKLYVGDIMVYENKEQFISAYTYSQDITVNMTCANFIELVPNVGEVYSVDGGETWNDNGVFQNLKANTEYTVLAKTTHGFKTKSLTVKTSASHTYRGITIKPTCTEDGYTKMTCTTCGYVHKTNFKPAGHAMEYIETVPASKSEQGYDLYMCSMCGEEEKRNLTDYVEPEAPTDRVNNVIATPSDVDVTLSWDAFDGATEYYAKVYDKDFAKCLKTITTTDTSAVFDYKTLSYNTDYKFIVTAKLDSGKYLTVANATRVDGAMVIGNRVVGHTLTMEGKGAIVDFLPIENATEYLVNVFENDAQGERIYTATLTSDTTSARVMNNLTAGTKYVVMINAKVDGKYMSLADLRVNGIAVTFTAPVINPSSITIADETATSIRFNWDAVRGAEQYFIKVTEKESGKLVNTLKAEGKTTATLSRYTDGTRISPNTTYLLQFYTYVNSTTNSGVYGEPIEITTIGYEDVNVTANENDITGKIDVLWNSTTNSVGYFVYTYKDGVKIANKYVDGKENTSISLTAPTASGTYTYGVVAYEKNSSGTAYTPVSVSNKIVK